MQIGSINNSLFQIHDRIVTHQIIQHIVEDELVIADLTDGNPNVLYELALRHAIRKPFVHIAQSTGTLPFDVAPARTIHFTDADMSSVDNCKQELARQIKAIEQSNASVESPISVGIDILQLRRSDNLVEKSNAEILSMLQDLRGEFVKILREQSERISELESLLAINARNDLKDQSSCTELPLSTGSSISREWDWDNFLMNVGPFDRTNLLELLDDLIDRSTQYTSIQQYIYTQPYSYFGFRISTDLHGDYRIEFLTCTITVRKEDLKIFRDYVKQNGIYAGIAGAQLRL